MKQILTRLTSLVRQLPIAANDTIANSTFALPLHRTINIALKRCQCIDQAAVEDSNCAKRGAEPGLPFRFVDGDAVEAFDVGVCEREGRGKGDAHRHCLFVDGVGGCDFAGAWGHFDSEG
jgi:hypothetical protein